MWRIILRALDGRVVDDFTWEHPVSAEAPPDVIDLPLAGRFQLRVTSGRSAFYVAVPS